MLLCRDGSFYTGITADLTRRMEEHNTGRGAKYTRTRRPVKLVYVRMVESRSEAQKREAWIKRLSHKAKEMLLSDLPQFLVQL